MNTPAITLFLGFIASLLMTVGIFTGNALWWQTRINSAADSAALAAATVIDAGQDPCGQATIFASRYQVKLTSCTVHGQDVRVQVSPSAQLYSWLTATAVAGPQPGG